MGVFVPGRGGEGSQHLRDRLDGWKFLPLRLAHLQFVHPLAAWFDGAFVTADSGVVRFAGLLEAFANFVEMHEEGAQPAVQLLRRAGDGPCIV